MKRYWKRIVATLVLLGLGYLAFELPPSPQTIADSVTDTRVITTSRGHGQQFFQWVGVLLLALSVWVWRDLLKLTSVGPLGGLPMDQQNPEDLGNRTAPGEESGDSESTFGAAVARLEQRKFSESKKFVIDYLKRHSALNVHMLARELELTSRAAEALLAELAAEGVLRRDGYPRSTMYTLAMSLENLAIDYIRDKWVSPRYRLLAERRYVRIKRRFEVDAVLECEERTFIIEVKVPRSPETGRIVEQG